MNMLQIILLCLLSISSVFASKYQEYPLSELDSITYKPYAHGQSVPIQCIRRQIDNGEHIFDENGQIVYGQFFKCLETNKPLELTYLKDSNIKCTVKFEDEIFHLFQLYLHKDAPFTCRYELRPDSGIYIPFDLSFRGNVLESHFDIDPNLNVLMISNKENEIVAGTAFSSSANTTKVIIGQNVELNFNIKWANVQKTIYDQENNLAVYWISTGNSFINFIYGFSGLFIGIVLTFIISYKRIGKKVQANAWTNKVE
jgi:hypothetical protein